MSFVEHDGGLWVPDHATHAQVVGQSVAPTAMLDNRTDLPDAAIIDYFEENTAAFGWNERPNFRSMQDAPSGSALARGRWTPPSNIIDEIKLARDLAERDDDVAPAIESLIAAAFADGYQNQHADEQIEHTFDKITETMGLRRVLAELYREWLISYQINTVTIFTRESFDIRPEGVSRVLNRNVASPLVGVLPAENIRIIGDDLFGNAALAYVPEGELGRWLQEYHGDSTTAAKKAQMRRENPIRAALFIGKVTVEDIEQDFFGMGTDAYRLNPTMVDRSTAPKGTWKYPRPILTRNLPLLEAKRLLNIMDHALLQGGTNYIIVAKKGSKEQPALQPEIENLKEVVKRASRSGVLIGDHRIDIEIVTPDLTELLNPAKRSLIGQKLTLGMLRVPGLQSKESGNQSGDSGSSTLTELVQRTITWDRNMVRDHLHDKVWSKTMNRNQAVFGRVDRPTLWMPKIILAGQQFFTEYLLKMYDRGDLPRKWMIEFGGFDYDGAIAQKKREVAAGHDDIFQPPAVPFSSPSNGPGGGGQGGPNDNQPGPGRGNGRTDPARPTRVVRRTPGETVRAFWSEDDERVIRIGTLTEQVIAQYPDSELGRMTPIEIEACTAMATTQRGPIAVVPVNRDVPMDDLRVVRLEEGLSVICGQRVPDGAIMARAITAREPQFDLRAVEDMVIRWGFEISIAQEGDVATCDNCGAIAPVGSTECPDCGAAMDPAHPPGPDLPHHRRRRTTTAEDDLHGMELHVHIPGQAPQAFRTEVIRDPETQAIVGTRQVPIEPGGE